MNIKSITAIIKEGHQVASGIADDSPYPQGSIIMQAPYFKQQGVNLDDYYKATLNLSIAPFVFELTAPEFTIYELQWAEGFSAEDFSFSRCEIVFKNELYSGLIYYPHPETKIGHFHSQSLIEVIAGKIPNIAYGDEVILKYNEAEVSIKAK